MFHVHRYRIVDVEHFREKTSLEPITYVSYICGCGKPKFRRIDGYFTADQLRGKR